MTRVPDVIPINGPASGSPASLPDLALWDRLATGAPLLVIVAILVTLGLWRHMLAREARWDEERKRESERRSEERSREHERWDEERRREQEVREKLVREVVTAVAANTQASREQREMIRELKDAIEERRPQYSRSESRLSS